MRKMLSILVALVMLCALLPVVAEGVDVTGVWYLNTLKMGETEMSPSAIGMNLSFDLQEDGTAIAVVANEEGTEEQSGTWALQEDGTLVITQDGEGVSFTVGEGSFEGDIGGIVGIFTREAPAAEAKPAPVAAESEDSFLGTWKLSKVDMDGTILPVDMLTETGIQMDITLTVEAGKASIVMNAFGVETPPIAGATTLTDGTLAMNVEGLPEPIVLTMCDTGEIFTVITAEALNTSIPMYFALAE